MTMEISNSDYIETDDEGFDIFNCPECDGAIIRNGIRVGKYYHSYCPNCGEEIRWALDSLMFPENV